MTHLPSFFLLLLFYETNILVHIDRKSSIWRQEGDKGKENGEGVEKG